MAVREVKLPSGAILKIHTAPFVDAKTLFQALLKEIKKVNIKADEWEGVLKDIVCSAFSSPEIEECIKKCWIKCLYMRGDVPKKLSDSLFDDQSTWEDYISILIEVAKENVSPFLKSLFAQSKDLVSPLMTEKSPE